MHWNDGKFTIPKNCVPHLLRRTSLSEKKKWSPLDRASLRQAEAAYRAQCQAARAEDAEEGAMEGDAQDVNQEASAMESTWRPTMMLYLKICLVYRGVLQKHSWQQARTPGTKLLWRKEFLRMVQEETDLQKDADGRCVGLCIQAEAMRQGEHWEEALKLADDGCALQPELSTAGIKTGCLHFCYLVLAYAHFAQGRPHAAQEER
eukprot:g9082.t1